LQVGSDSFYTFCDALASGTSPSQSSTQEAETVLENYAQYIKKVRSFHPILLSQLEPLADFETTSELT
jgi:hypothetical protein